MKKHTRHSLFTVFLMLILVVNAIASDAWNLGSYSFVTGAASEPLKATMGGARGLASHGFVGSVGGIAFEAIAVPEKKLKDKIMSLSYDSTKPDGHRLSISIGERTYRPFLPDWQLVPVANYANSRYDACISLFGPNASKYVYDIVYHPAFENTLLGLRLLQADIMLMDITEFWQLPKYNGKLILGFGETMPDRNNWKNAAREISLAMQGDAFQSWVFTDFGEKVQFGVDKKEFGLTGYPYYYFWKADVEKYKHVWNEYARKAEEYKKMGLIQEHNRMVMKANNLKPEVFEVKYLTKRIRGKRAVIQKVNPVVYNAANQTMRFAAFFRYIKKTDKVLWGNFLKQLQHVQIEPSIKTPTKWERQKAIIKF